MPVELEHRYAPAGMTTGDAEKVAFVLQHRLAALIDLSLTLKHVHWNVVGPGFIAMHELMDEQVDVVRGFVDEIAERISTLGGVAAGLPGLVVQRRGSDDYALGRAPVPAHLGALDKVYERVGKGHREAIGDVDEIDPISGDLLITQASRLELHHWLIRSHLSDTSGRLVTESATDEMDAAIAAAYALQPEFEETVEIGDLNRPGSG